MDTSTDSGAMLAKRKKKEIYIYNRDVAPLFKIKRAILEETDELDATRVVVDKSKKKVFFVEEFSLQLVATMISKSNIVWEDGIGQEVKDRYLQLIE